MFDLGVAVLTDAGLDEKQSRSLIGKWRKDYGDGEVMSALTDCRARSISNPVEWMPKRLKTAKPAEKTYAELCRERYGDRPTAPPGGAS